MRMKIIIKENEKINIINKSKFIGIIKRIMTKEEARVILNNVKDKYPLANHICYAYILPDIQKYSDDAEPIGTAGIPILDVLKKNEISYTIAIVVRFFGGIKLGSNGLIRAYSGVIKELLNDNVKDIEEGFVIHIEEDYHNNNLLDYLLKDDITIKHEYQDKIIIDAIVKKKTLDKLSNISYKIKDKTII